MLVLCNNLAPKTTVTLPQSWVINLVPKSSVFCCPWPSFRLSGFYKLCEQPENTLRWQDAWIEMAFKDPQHLGSPQVVGENATQLRHCRGTRSLLAFLLKAKMCCTQHRTLGGTAPQGALIHWQPPYPHLISLPAAGRVRSVWKSFLGKKSLKCTEVCPREFLVLY